MWLNVREVVGWVLVAIGLLMIWWAIDQAAKTHIIQSAAISFPATIVFRAGIGFVRFASAARIAMRLRNQRLEG